MLKHIVEFLAAVAVIPLLIWLKCRQVKDNTVFSNDEGPQTLFDHKKNDAKASAHLGFQAAKMPA